MIPITIGGKIFTFVILFIGLGIFAVPVGLIASALTKTSTEDDDEGRGMITFIDVDRDLWRSQ
jgi:voltage-gated potassium channel